MTDVSPNVEVQITRLIYPFFSELSYPQLQQAVDAQCWEAKGINRRSLFSHIAHLVDPENPSAIGKRHVLYKTPQARTAFGLPDKPSIPFLLDSRRQDQASYTFTIPNVELYLFETRVGFVVFDVAFSKDTTLDTIQYVTYVLKRFGTSLKSYGRLHIERKQRDGVEDKDFSFCHSCQQMLRQADARFPIDNALVYSAIVLGSLPDAWVAEDTLQTRLFELRHAFKSSYKPPELEFQLDKNEQVLQLFENSFWGASLEGLANLAYLVEDKSTNAFFTSTYIPALRETYFFIYILALQQRFALLHLNSLVTHMPASMEDYLDESGNTSSQLQQSREEIVFFILRSQFRNVSNFTHQDRLYQSIRKVLAVDPLLEELHYELETLASLTQIYESKRREQKDKEEQEARRREEIAEAAAEERRKRLENIIALVSTVFVIVSTANDILTLINQKYPHHGPRLYVFVGSSVLLFIGFVVVAVLIWRMIRERGGATPSNSDDIRPGP